jgi:hypothetical protein
VGDHAYLITSTITTPLYGKLSDIYGRRPYFLTAISLFVVGSALAAMSTSMYQLAALPGDPGLGAGGLFSLALAIIGDIVPPRERARYQGFFLAVFGTASVLGPVIGGFPGRPVAAVGDHRVALGVPDQRADRDRRADRGGAARCTSRTPAATNRIDVAGAAALDRASGAAADRRRAGPDLGVDQRQGLGLLPDWGEAASSGS